MSLVTYYRRNYLRRNLLHWMGVVLHGQCESHRHPPAEPPALLGVHPIRHRSEEPPGSDICYGFCPVPSGVWGGELCERSMIKNFIFAYLKYIRHPL